MNKYSEIIRRVLDNANVTSENSNDRMSIRRDIEDTLKDMFMTTEAPIKTSFINVTENTPISIGSTFIADTTYTYPSLINSMKNLSVTFVHLPGTVGTTNAKLKIVSSFGDTLLEEDIVLTDEVEYSEDLGVTFTDLVGATLTLTLSDSADDVIYQMDWEETAAEIELDSEIYVPFEVTFKASEKVKSAIYNSKEMLEEEFIRWNPNGSSELEEPAASSELVAGVQQSNLQNIEFDNNIGYYFEVVGGIVKLHYKPAVKAVVALRHSYFPTVDVSEANALPIHTAFANCLVYGTTIKRLEKELLKAQTELDMVKIKSAIAVYTPKYVTALSDYTGFNRKKTQVHVVKMFDFLSDDSMGLY